MKVVLYSLTSRTMSKHVWYVICKPLNKHFFWNTCVQRIDDQWISGRGKLVL